MKTKNQEGRGEKGLHIMCRRNALEEDFGFRRINIVVDPSSPGGQSLVKCNQPVHIFVQFTPFLDIIPSVKHRNALAMKMKMKTPQIIKVDLRLRSSSMGPPMPSVEDQHVHAQPCVAIVYRIKLQYSSCLVIDEIYQVCRSIQQNLDSVVLLKNAQDQLDVTMHMHVW